ncbi:hypothetical protein FB451DRAFT_1369610 [Mycena latifolia]|nr:hypothetical protein FB451DRAFT_1369610 [Mycena latifolia]
MQINIFTLFAVAYAATQINAVPNPSCICETNGIQSLPDTEFCCNDQGNNGVWSLNHTCALTQWVPVSAARSGQRIRRIATLRAATQWARAARVGSRVLWMEDQGDSGASVERVFKAHMYTVRREVSSARWQYDRASIMSSITIMQPGARSTGGAQAMAEASNGGCYPWIPVAVSTEADVNMGSGDDYTMAGCTCSVEIYKTLSSTDCNDRIAGFWAGSLGAGVAVMKLS